VPQDTNTYTGQHPYTIRSRVVWQWTWKGNNEGVGDRYSSPRQLVFCGVPSVVERLLWKF